MAGDLGSCWVSARLTASMAPLSVVTDEQPKGISGVLCTWEHVALRGCYRDSSPFSPSDSWSTSYKERSLKHGCGTLQYCVWQHKLNLKLKSLLKISLLLNVQNFSITHLAEKQNHAVPVHETVVILQIFVFTCIHMHYITIIKYLWHCNP